ncbi:hypothetical protein H257_18223 [Aphanomyces astaci]|uniref:Uncharacterized protein n=1 Tax=Aphanomyces astaci TaxID=112090 RepID=W4FE04_APHAT|nr:hypothetical protein H257_18223 [Aphanomyces astaci]ETV64968.1 hypothetical protein H257_18223 [Aphanomyces astaci]|eukprot:XP_009845544.1 hypothetical protein H257_18223 [Aphanomyces astaci]
MGSTLDRYYMKRNSGRFVKKTPACIKDHLRTLMAPVQAETMSSIPLIDLLNQPLGAIIGVQPVDAAATMKRHMSQIETVVKQVGVDIEPFVVWGTLLRNSKQIDMIKVLTEQIKPLMDRVQDIEATLAASARIAGQ